jgi:hypothetical protein
VSTIVGSAGGAGAPGAGAGAPGAGAGSRLPGFSAAPAGAARLAGFGTLSYRAAAMRPPPPPPPPRGDAPRPAPLS